MLRRVLLDTGQLVALLNRQDSQHLRCVDALATIEPPLITCWPVLTEAAWLLRNDRGAFSRLVSSIESGLITLLEISERELLTLDALRLKYANLQPQLADVTLLHLANREDITVVFA